VTLISEEQAHSALVITFAGQTSWSGDLTGSTTYTGRGRINNRSGDLVASVRETFRGSVKGIGAGTLEFSELLQQDGATGAVTVVGHVTGGTGALAGVRGTLHFSGSSDATGFGGGSFRGELTNTG